MAGVARLAIQPVARIRQSFRGGICPLSYSKRAGHTPQPVPMTASTSWPLTS